MLPAELIELLRGAQNIVVLCGSGVSAESGVPTFRDAQSGVWAKFRPEDLATPEAFARDPQRVWDWYAWRRELVSNVQPNAGHVALAQLQQLLPGLTVITQNVDGLHQRAGSTDVIEFHGNLHIDRCFSEGVALGPGEIEPGRPPVCKRCSGLVRPGVVWFGEAIDEQLLTRALEDSAQCDVFIAAGTSAQVYPAAGLADVAQNSGATLVEINPAATPLSANCDFQLKGNAASLLPAITQLYLKESD